MTEEDAKTKWCFHFIASHTDPRTPPSQYEREAGMDGPFRHHCIGSACMAWRWNEPWTSITEEGVGGDLVIRLKRKPGEPRLGYCGLAGAPQ